MPMSAEDDIEGALGDRIPVVDRPVENVEHRHRADEGIGARAKLQRVGMRRQPDIDRQHPQLLQQLQHAHFGGQRQRHDQHVDAGDAGELDQFGNGAELGIAGNDRRRALVAAIVEDAADADIVVGLLFDRADQHFGRLAAADDDGAALHAAIARPAPDEFRHHQPETEEQDEADDEPGAEQAGANSPPTSSWRRRSTPSARRLPAQTSRMRPKLAIGRISATTW